MMLSVDPLHPFPCSSRASLILCEMSKDLLHCSRSKTLTWPSTRFVADALDHARAALITGIATPRVYNDF